MTDLPDYDLHPDTSAPSPPTHQRPIGPWIVLGLLAVAAAVAVYVLFGRGGMPASAPAVAPTTAAKAPAPSRPLGEPAAAVNVPPLDESDPVVRRLVGALSSSPAVTAWLTTNGLIRNFTLVVANIEDGRAPAKQLKPLRPSGDFRVVQRDGGTFVDPRSYDRYNTIADAVQSIDPEGAAKLYSTLKPRIEEAFRDLGYPDRPFDVTLERAIVTLLETPVPDAQLRVKPKGIGYAYTDDNLEQLSPPQKQLLRMGPRNARLVKEKLRAIAIALGIPAGRLPH